MPLHVEVGAEPNELEPAIYRDEETGKPISTQSMIKTFRNSPREAYYKYVLRLKPKSISKPLRRGTWLHALLETYYNGDDWEAEHQKYVKEFSRLFDEEKESLGNLPQEMHDLMTSYLWNYSDPQYKEYQWKVHETEVKLTAEMPNGHLFRGVIDAIVEDDFGLWLADHKTHKRLPDWNYRMLDEQSAMYIWLARQNDIPVRGFIWNYLTTEAISTPKVLKSGATFYAKDFSAVNTDYPTFARAVKKAMVDYPDTFLKDPDEKARVKARLAQLKAQRWSPNNPAASPFFRRDVIEKTDGQIERVLKPFMRTSERMHSYDFSDPDYIEGNVDFVKGFFCSYRDLYISDLVSGDSAMLQRQNYTAGEDPLSYQDKESPQ